MRKYKKVIANKNVESADHIIQACSSVQVRTLTSCELKLHIEFRLDTLDIVSEADQRGRAFWDGDELLMRARCALPTQWTIPV